MSCLMLSNDADVLPKVRREAFCGVVGIREIFATTGIQCILKMLEVEGEVEYSLIITGEGTLLERRGDCRHGEESEVPQHGALVRVVRRDESQTCA